MNKLKAKISQVAKNKEAKTAVARMRLATWRTIWSSRQRCTLGR